MTGDVPRLGQAFIDRVDRGLVRAQTDELGRYPLTKAEFDEGFQLGASGVAVLHEDGMEWLCAYGFLDETVMAGMVNESDRERRAERAACKPSDVEHWWAVCPANPYGADRWFIQWGDPTTESTRNAFPLTVVTRG